MKIGIIGSGYVAQILAKGLLDLGHEVMISSRDINKEKKNSMMGALPSAKEWADDNSKEGKEASAGSFFEAAYFGEVLINCTSGVHSIEALKSAGTENMEGKILVDLANPLDFSKGMPPTLTVSNTTSLGEEIQKEFPKVRVVKALNTINAELMIKPQILPGEHDLFICGNDDEAKEWVSSTLLKEWFGWMNVIDLGDISAARGTEMYLPLWLRLWGYTKSGLFNVHVVKKD